MPAVLGYARVSTSEQDLAAQRIRLEQAGAARIFEDKISGRRPDRPGLAALLDYARPGDTVLVVRFDRLGRSTVDLIQLVDHMRAQGLEIRFIEQNIDTSTPGGKFMMQVFASLAEFERNVNSSRTRDALVAARARGKRLGRPPRDEKKIAAALLLIDGEMSPTEAAKTVGLSRTIMYEVLKEHRAAAAEAERRALTREGDEPASAA